MTRKMIPVGWMALRGPGGEFLPSVQIYAAADDVGEDADKYMINDASKMFAEKYKQYVDGVKKAKGAAK